MKAFDNVKAIIPLTAGSITVANFIYGLFYSINPSNTKLIEALISFPIAIRILAALLLSLFASMTFVKIVTKSHTGSNDMATKMSILAIVTTIFAWIVVFNFKIIIGTSIDHSGIEYPILIISAIIFSMFSSLKINYNLREQYHDQRLSHKLYKTEIFYPSDYFYTPVYIRAIRFISFYLVSSLCILLL